MSEGFRLNDIKFYRLILLRIIFIFILILTSTLSLRYGRNLRIRLPTECPRYTHPPLLSHDGYCLGVDVKPSLLLSCRLTASPPWGSHSRSSLTPAHEVWFSTLPRILLCTSLSILRGWKASRFVRGRRHGAGLSVEVGLGLLGLYL